MRVVQDDGLLQLTAVEQHCPRRSTSGRWWGDYGKDHRKQQNATVVPQTSPLTHHRTTVIHRRPTPSSVHRRNGLTENNIPTGGGMSKPTADDAAQRRCARRGADSIRTSIAKACRAAGVPLWSPHDLRHRRISLLHRQGRTWAEIGALVGQRSLKVTSDTYTHVLIDGRELDYAALLAGAHSRPSGDAEVLAQRFADDR
jgi:integrase